MTAQITLPRAMSEADWTAWVVDVAKLNGFMVHHSRPARTTRGWRTPITGHVGVPDLLLARDGMVLAAELKSNAGNLRPEQKEWLRHLGPHGCLWRPRDADQVLARLGRGGSS